MEVTLHLGVHKTATTYIQQRLEANEELLLRERCAYVPLHDVRRTVTARLGAPPADLSSAVQGLLRRYEQHGRLIISDENIIGLCGDAFREGSFYASVEARLSALMRSLPDQPIRAFVGLRSYDSFVSSMYCEHIRHYPFVTPAEYLSAVDIEQLDWCELLGVVCRIVGQEQVTVWRFEDFGWIEETILSVMSGVSMPLQRTGANVRRSLSQAAVDTLCRLRPTLSRKLVRMLVRPAEMLLPKRSAGAAFRAFEGSDAAALRSRYADDMVHLEAKYPKVRMLRPQP